MYLRLTYLWYNKCYIFVLIIKSNIGFEKLPCLVLRRNDHVMKNIHNIGRGKQRPW